MGLAGSLGSTTSSKNSAKDNSTYTNTNFIPSDDTGGENGQIPPPPQ